MKNNHTSQEFTVSEETPIADLELSTRAINCATNPAVRLSYARYEFYPDIKTVGDLVRWGADLSKLANVGRKTLAEYNWAISMIGKKYHKPPNPRPQSPQTP